jgi:hypothetical protein
LLGRLDADILRVAGYVAVAVAAAVSGGLERRRAVRCPELRPGVWFVVAGLFVLMAFGRAGNVGQAIAEVGRRGAQSSGWYQSRRSLQEVLVLAVGTIAVLLAAMLPAWTHERRRHYLPMVLVTFAVMAFAAVRIVSLHQLDDLMHRPLLGTTFGTAAELFGLAIAGVVAVASWRPDAPQPTG